ncbi:hypothetical protein EBU71_16940 [bacterium]|nr:hypothetical protein [Candidatus Elulimicrobium humile]
MYSDFSTFSGMIMANVKVIAAAADGSGNGMAGEYRINMICASGSMTVSSVVEVAQEMIGLADLDVDVLSDGKIRLQQAAVENVGYKWHVQRQSVIAIDGVNGYLGSW